MIVADDNGVNVWKMLHHQGRWAITLITKAGNFEWADSLAKDWIAKNRCRLKLLKEAWERVRERVRRYEIINTIKSN